ncbi:hypothetical protein D9M68_1001520 [compost metagenome]
MHRVEDVVGVALLFQGAVDAGRLAHHVDVLGGDVLGDAGGILVGRLDAIGQGQRQGAESEARDADSGTACVHGGIPQE